MAGVGIDEADSTLRSPVLAEFGPNGNDNAVTVQKKKRGRERPLLGVPDGDGSPPSLVCYLQLAGSHLSCMAPP